MDSDFQEEDVPVASCNCWSSLFPTRRRSHSSSSPQASKTYDHHPQQLPRFSGKASGKGQGSLNKRLHPVGQNSIDLPTVFVGDPSHPGLPSPVKGGDFASTADVAGPPMMDLPLLRVRSSPTAGLLGELPVLRSQNSRSLTNQQIRLSFNGMDEPVSGGNSKPSSRQLTLIRRESGVSRCSSFNGGSPRAGGDIFSSFIWDNIKVELLQEILSGNVDVVSTADDADTPSTPRALQHSDTGLTSHQMDDLCLQIADLDCENCRPLLELDEREYIGRGAHGLVYKGYWQSAPVAVKYVVSNCTKELHTSTTEALLSKALSHPNIVQTYAAKVVRVSPEQFAHDMDTAHCQQLTQQEPQLPECLAQAVTVATDNCDPFGVPGLAQLSPASTLSPAVTQPESWYAVQSPALSAACNLSCTSNRPAGSCEPDGLCKEDSVSSFNSNDGFGKPYLEQEESCDNHFLEDEDAESSWKLRLERLANQLNAKPGSFITQLVMEWCDRDSLLAAIKKGVFKATNKWSSRQALRALIRTAREIAAGMCHLHSNNIIHGDLKPGNILLKSSRSDIRGFVAKVADFGLSKVLTPEDGSVVRTSEPGSKGTLAYMAPEAFDGELSMANDVYSFGVLLWQMVTGETPFDGEHPARLMYALPLGELKLEWPANGAGRALASIGEKCLSFDPKERPTFHAIAKGLGMLEQQVRRDAAAASCSSQPPQLSPTAVNGYQPSPLAPSRSLPINPIMVASGEPADSTREEPGFGEGSRAGRHAGKRVLFAASGSESERTSPDSLNEVPMCDSPPRATLQTARRSI